VPSRVASGFAPGEFDPDTGISTVRENHAHSWVEAYFPRYGWVTFEPSAIRPLPIRNQEPSQPTPVVSPEPSASASGRLTREELDELLDIQDSGGFVPTFNRRVLYCAWDNLKDGQVFFAGSTDRNESRRRGARSRSARSGPSSFASSRDC